MLVPAAQAQSNRPPQPEVVRAERALNAALEAAADLHAPAELQAAQAALAAARDAESRRRRSEAATLGQRAELEARLAEARAHSQRLRAEVSARSEDNARLRRDLLDGGLQ
ncbi:DUF4398 domain-containing protein [Aquimonas sp.]|jgi:hypothetical protein|uniref:DUF4398 domain-containing protein n=1 Tax=Aquimonas sp. TaxID=1872588 RepID=UPI0037BFE70C